MAFRAAFQAILGRHRALGRYWDWQNLDCIHGKRRCIRCDDALLQWSHMVRRLRPAEDSLVRRFSSRLDDILAAIEALGQVSDDGRSERSTSSMESQEDLYHDRRSSKRMVRGFIDDEAIVEKDL